MSCAYKLTADVRACPSHTKSQDGNGNWACISASGGGVIDNCLWLGEEGSVFPKRTALGGLTVLRSRTTR